MAALLPRIKRLLGFGPKPPKPKKGPIREWIDAIVFAAGAAILIRTFLVEAFMIPTASMERSLMVGDFLFVSKFHYGTRLPMAPLSFPFVHNTLPLSNTRSWLGWPRLPYLRLPGFMDVERNDVVVFNYPADDINPTNPRLGPVDIPSLKENYIKRCVAVPGDRFEIRQGQVYIDGQVGWNPPELQNSYTITTGKEGFNELVLKEYGFRPLGDRNQNYMPLGTSGPGQMDYIFYMPTYLADTFATWPFVKNVRRTVERMLDAQDPRMADYFGFDVHRYGWSLDNFGPLVVPKKGEPLALTPENLTFYVRVIEAYEGHQVELRDSTIYIDGQPATSFTPALNYYFMMGDNRYNSQDSRYWGFVPEDHIVGKPLFVFFSRENGIRWNRIFKAIE